MNKYTMSLILNLIESNGDIADKYKKYLFSDVEDKEILTEELVKEINFSFSYLMKICDELEIDKKFI